MAIEPVGDGAHDGRRRHHADLHRVGPDIVEDGIDLGAHENGIHLEHAGDAERVLSRERRNGALPKQMMGGDGLQVGLDARSPTGIGSGNGENRFHGRSFRNGSRLSAGRAQSHHFTRKGRPCVAAPFWQSIVDETGATPR